MSTNEKRDESTLWRVILAMIGLGIAFAGWSLIMTAILSFIGLPLFIFGLALAQAQER
jgi:hypothetical protein